MKKAFLHPKTQHLWVYENDGMVQRTISFVPGLYKIFDETLVKVLECHQRNPSLMDHVKVDIDAIENMISIYNNGDGVPKEVSKLTKQYSSEFVIERAYGTNKFKQVFSNSKPGDPETSTCEASEKWTKVTFKPDLKKFNITSLEEDIVALMKKRVVDMAGLIGKTVKVELNGTTIPIKSFDDYAKFFIVDQKQPRIYAEVSEWCEIVVTLSSERKFQQVSFVNSIATINGGTHVGCIKDQITAYVLKKVKKKKKDFGHVEDCIVEDNLWVFVKVLIDNPKFDSQLNETLTTVQTSFASNCNVPESTLKEVQELFEKIYAEIEIRRIVKFEDAKYAGDPEKSKNCILILTEGDSAKTLAMAGLSVAGRDYYGVFPLKGKFLNVQGASMKQISENIEINSIRKIVGLEFEKEYLSVDSLRYGQLMIMADQDYDGSHIKGLLINFIYTCWPSLLKLKVPSPFMAEFVTPIYRAFHKIHEKNILSFFTIPEYDVWRKNKSINLSEWKIKYYKGLGTSTDQEGIEYFENIDFHIKEFIWKNEDDGKAIDIAFSKGKGKVETDKRKAWIIDKYKPDIFLDHTPKGIRIEDFIDKELVLYSMEDNKRSIPSMVDGLKPCQRKILFCAFKNNNLIKEIKVDQFAGYVSLHSAYRHGEVSLQNAIIGMAQDYVGANNINFLKPIGQFGTRNMGGKDHAQPSYISTKLNDITRLIFHKDDDNILEYLNEDGESIEPKWYIPIIPTILLNGCDGIGTGWSSQIPSYSPWDIIKNIRHMLNDEELEEMDPWYRGFKGTIEKNGEGGKYLIGGLVERVEEESKTFRITELPIGKWSEDYKMFLESITVGTSKDPFIESFEQQHADDSNVVDFLIKTRDDKDKKEVIEKCKLIRKEMMTSNMHLFDSKSKKITKYESTKPIFEDFYPLRLECYDKRQEYLMGNLNELVDSLDNKIRFTEWVYNKGALRVLDREDPNLLNELKDNQFATMPKSAEGYDGYEYLLSLPITSYNPKSIDKLRAEQAETRKKRATLNNKTVEEMWKKDLDDLEKKLDELYKRRS